MLQNPAEQPAGAPQFHKAKQIQKAQLCWIGLQTLVTA